MSNPSDPSARPWLAELRACLALSWPLMLTNATEMGMNITNAAAIGRISSEALAASMLALALFQMTLLFAIGVTASISALIARELGQGGNRDAAVRRIVQQGFWGAAALAGPISLLLWNGDAVFRITGQDPRLTEAAVGYLHILQWALGPALVYLVLRALFASLEQPRWTVVTGVAAVALNALLNWLLIDGHWGAPALGLAGSALATVLSNLFMAAALALVALWHPRIGPIRIFTGLLFRPDFTGWSAFWRLGLPIGVSLLLETGMFAGAAALIGHFGAVPLAAHAIAIQVASFTFMVPLGVAQAATVRVGRAFGAGDRSAVARSGWTALALGVSTMVISATLMVGVPQPIVGLFIASGEPEAEAVTALAVTLLSLAALFQVADGAQVVLSGMLRGLHEGRAPMLIAAVGYWIVGLPLGAALAFASGLGAPGIWIGLTAGLFAAAVLLLLRWRSRLQSPFIGALQGAEVPVG